MRFEDYTKDQQKAIISKGANIIVSAGAGSGKTQVLTERVVHFIRDENYKLNEFLILTFTNLAAGEMKDRIRRALAEEKLEAANDVDLADICTFDSYALSLVKKYHFMLNVSPNVSIVDSNIIDVRKRRIIETLFDEEYTKKEDVFKSLIETYCFKDDDDLRNLLLKFYNKSLLEIDSKKYIDNFFETYFCDEIIDEIKHKIFVFLNDLKEEIFKLVYLMPEVQISGKDTRTVLETYEEYVMALGDAKTYSEVVNSMPEEMESIRLPKGCSKEVQLAKMDLNKRLTKFKKTIDSLPKSDELFKKYFTDIIPFVELFIKMLKSLDEQIVSFKKCHQVYEFQDIAKMALELVKTNEEVRSSIKNSLKMIMIDEYQDTSFLQEAFVSYIANNNVYMVGDVKQSIYRFRNARCDIFVDKYKRYSNNEGGIAIDLNKNFRSRKEVLDDINYIFKQLMTEKYGEADYAKSHVIEYGNKDYIKAGDKKDNNIDFIVYPPCKSAEAPEIEANLVARDIIDKINKGYQVLDYVKDENGKKNPILRNCKFSDFCILMDRGVAFDTYSRIFNEYKLPLYVENDEDISSNDLVVILTNILRLMKSIRDCDYNSKEFLKAFLSVARSFVFEYTDQQLFDICEYKTFEDDPMIIMLKDILFKYSFLSISELFEKIIYELDIYHKCISIGNVAKNEKYLNTFMEMFKTMSSLDYSIDDFILFMECVDEYNLKITLSSTGSPFNSIRIMNIHKSKGLEFNIIYYSGLKKMFNRMDLDEQYGISSKYGFILPPADPNMDNIVRRVNAMYEVEEDTSEKIRLLYVALTRTREKMICLMQSSAYNYYIQDVYMKQYQKYLDQHALADMDKEEAFKLIYSDFLGKEFSYVVFTMLAKFIDYDLPYKYLQLDIEDKYEISYEDLMIMIQEMHEYDKRINEIVNKLFEEFVYPNEAVLGAFKLYKEYEISFEEFLDVVYGLGMGLDASFHDKIEDLSKENACSIDELDRSLIELKNDWIFVLEEVANNPLLSKKCKNQTYALAALSLCVFGLISIADLDKYLGIMGIQFIPEIYDILAEEEPEIEDYMYSCESIVNPIFDFDEKEAFVEYINNIRNAYSSKLIDDIDTFRLLYFAYKKIPYESEMNYAVEKLMNREIDFASFLECVNVIGFELKPEATKMYSNIYAGLASDEEVEEFMKEGLPKHVFINEDTFFDFIEEVDSFSCDAVLKKMFMLFKTEEINMDKFKQLINCLNYELTKEFSILTLEEQLAYYPDDIDLIVVDKGHLRTDANLCTSFADFIDPYNGYKKFGHYAIDISIKNPSLKGDNEEIEHKNLLVDNLSIKNEIIQMFRASKELNLNASKKNMEFGTMIHFMMEITDFKNPNYDQLDEMYRSIVKKILESTLMQDVNNANIYKEYEFIDDVDNVRGIIDLMLVYNDHIDIIDYKTKNIDDESYDKQLLIYKKYISKKSKLPINIYLYSLLDGVVKKV